MYCFKFQKIVKVDSPVGFLQNIISYQRTRTVSGSQPFTDANIISMMLDFFLAGEIKLNISTILYLTVQHVIYPPKT